MVIQIQLKTNTNTMFRNNFVSEDYLSTTIQTWQTWESAKDFIL